MAPKIEPRKLLDHSIKDIYVGKSKEALDIVGDHSLGVKEVTSMFGHFIKYRLPIQNFLGRKPLHSTVTLFGPL